MKELQETSTHLDDIPFNFLIGDDSNIYEGRGFERQGQHSSNEDATEYNSIGICVAFIGNYSSVELNETQINVFNEFLEYFLQKGIIVENYVLLSHDQLVYNENPADKLFDEIQNWSGFRKRRYL